MKTIKELIENKMAQNHLNEEQAKNLVCQEVIIRKIAASEYSDRVLLKGGVVMFYMTKNQRRATRDMDFDLVRYDISHQESIDGFIYSLNKYLREYDVKLRQTKQLHQEDYHGVRLFIKISDKSTDLNFTIDIGIHTLFAIDQIDSIFEFGAEDGDKIKIKVNPPEQIIAEKLYSIAKIGILSTRYKDLFDVYYLIKNSKLNIKVVDKCIELLTLNCKFGIKDRVELVSRLDKILSNKNFEENLKKSNSKWLDVEYNDLKETILNYLY